MTNRRAVIMFCLLAGLTGLTAFAAPPAPSTLDKKVKSATAKIAPELIAIRRDLHCHPELGLQETRTSGLVADYFRKLGLEVRTGYAKTGVLRILKGGKPGSVVAMRGDMDALPITEETNLPFASKDKVIIECRETG